MDRIWNSVHPWGTVLKVPPAGVHPQFREMPEKTLHTQVQRWLRDGAAIGVTGYHTYRSDRSDPGFPDWCIPAGAFTFYLELKGWQPRVKTLGTPSPKQIHWLDRLSQNPNNVVRLVYPWDWPDISTRIWTEQWTWNQAHSEARRVRV